MIDDVRSILKEMRTNIDKEFQDWFKEAKQIANKVGADIKIPRYAHCQEELAHSFAIVIMRSMSDFKYLNGIAPVIDINSNI